MVLVYSSNKSIEKDYKGKEMNALICRKKENGLFVLRDTMKGFRTSPIVAIKSGNKSLTIVTKNNIYKFA